jgi:hypothetical protein
MHRAVGVIATATTIDACGALQSATEVKISLGAPDRNRALQALIDVLAGREPVEFGSVLADCVSLGVRAVGGYLEDAESHDESWEFQVKGGRPTRRHSVVTAEWDGYCTARVSTTLATVVVEELSGVSMACTEVTTARLRIANPANPGVELRRLADAWSAEVATRFPLPDDAAGRMRRATGWKYSFPLRTGRTVQVMVVMETR